MGQIVTKKNKKKNNVTDKDKIILELKNARDKIKMYQDRLEIEKIKLHENARILLLAGKKDRAKICLKLKKYKENQLENASEQIFNLMKMIDSVEWESQQLNVYNGLKAGNKALEMIRKEMTIENVEKIMEDTMESQKLANEISELIGTSLSNIDEKDILEELEKIEKMETIDIDIDQTNRPIDTVVENTINELSKHYKPEIEKKEKTEIIQQKNKNKVLV